jgi:hypothetical protein
MGSDRDPVRLLRCRARFCGHIAIMRQYSQPNGFNRLLRLLLRTRCAQRNPDSFFRACLRVVDHGEERSDPEVNTQDRFTLP